jgi:hypothetical protein
MVEVPVRTYWSIIISVLFTTIYKNLKLSLIFLDGCSLKFGTLQPGTWSINSKPFLGDIFAG